MFYKMLAPVYHEIFPVDGKDRFLMRFFSNGDRLLDVGCSDGRVALEMTSDKYNCTVTGIDLSDDLLSIANQLASNKSNLNFIKLDMLNVNDHFEKSSFDGVYCIGNTLVHLLKESEIEMTLKGFWNILKPNGKIVVQILNYDMIMNEKLKQLPLIENEVVKFERHYHYEAAHIRFEATLTDKTSQTKPVTSDTKLYPLRKSVLFELLTHIGYKDVQFYSGFNGEAYDSSKLPLIVSARK